MPDPPNPTAEQLALPIDAGPGAPDAPATTRRRTRRRGPRQLWLFAPYLQPELPFDADPPTG